MAHNLHIVSAGTSLGSFSDGTEGGPGALFDAGLEPALANYFHISKHVKQPVIQESTRDSNAELILWLAQLRSQLAELPQTDRVLVLGGDHSIGGPSMLASATRLRQPAVVYVDAHPDCHRLETSQTGSLHGMPITMATGETLADRFDSPYIRPQDICFVGIKDIDSAEQDWLDTNKVNYFTMDAILEQGIAAVMSRVSEWVGERDLHVSFDIDAIDSQYAPGTGIQNSGGLTYREASYICRKLAELSPQTIDMVEVNPSRDVNSKTARLAVELIAALFSVRWDSYTSYVGQHI